MTEGGQTHFLQALALRSSAFRLTLYVFVLVTVKAAGFISKFKKKIMQIETMKQQKSLITNTEHTAGGFREPLVFGLCGRGSRSHMGCQVKAINRSKLGL